MTLDTRVGQSVAAPPPAAGLHARQWEALVGWLMASPAIFLIVLFMIVPFVMAFALAFTNQRLISPNPTEWVGGRNFAKLLTLRVVTLDPMTDPATGQPVLDEQGNLTYPTIRSLVRNNPDHPELNGLQEAATWTWGQTLYALLAGDSVFMRSILNILYFAVVVVPVQGGLGLVLAVIVNKRTSGVNAFRTIYFMPVVVSLVVVSILWRIIYDPNGGLLNNILGGLSFGLIQPIDWLGDPGTSMPAIILVSVWQGVGFHMVIWLAGLQNIPVSLYEAASLDGANGWQQFRYVTWPGLRDTTVFVLVTITIAAFGLFTQVQVMTNGGPLDSTTTVVYQAVQRGFVKQDIAYGSAISVVFFAMVLIVSLIQRYLTRERNA